MRRYICLQRFKLLSNDESQSKLEIKVPSIDSIHSVFDLWQRLRNLDSSYFAFALSFVFIFVSWSNHHVAFKLVDKSSGSFIYANGFLLLTLVFLPFTTALLAEYVTTDYAQPAVVFYKHSINSKLYF